MGVFGDAPAFIGHRGLGEGVVLGHAENTLASFTAAVDLGVLWVEADVRRTADDVLVVVHDPVHPDGARMAELPATETDRRAILRLDELLERLPPAVGINLDLKSSLEDSVRPPARTTAALLAPVVGREVGRRPVLVSSFDPAALHLLREWAPQVPLAWLTWYGFPLEAAVAGCAHLPVDVLGLHVGSLGEDPRTGRVDGEAVARTLLHLHAADRGLMVWCPAPEDVGFLLEAGVDAVVVDPVPGLPAPATLRRTA